MPTLKKPPEVKADEFKSKFYYQLDRHCSKTS